MRVIDYINQADPAKVEAIYTEEYLETFVTWSLPETFEKFRTYLNTIDSIENNFINVCIDYHESEDSNWYDVNILDGLTLYAADFVEWEEWKAYEVIDRTGKELDVDQIATHLYWEMTFHGWPDEMRKQKKQLEEIIESFDLKDCYSLDDIVQDNK